MASVEGVINWFKAREGKVTYSMHYRMGPNSYDCSSSMYFALIEAGFLPKGTAISNTDSLYRLEGSLLQAIGRGEVRRGDLFISGVKGGSGGSGGHTGVFLDNQTIIHCTLAPAYGKNGIVTTPAQGWMGDYSGLPVYYYRLKNSTPPTPTSKFKVGEKVNFSNSATKWHGGKSINYDDMMRGYKVSKINSDGSLYIRTLDDAWGGNVLEKDLMLYRSNTIGSNDVVKLRAAASHWANGDAINIENKTTRSFIVKDRKDNQLLLYSDAANGWEAWAYDWDCLLERKHKIVPAGATERHVAMNKNTTRWDAYKAITKNVKISLAEYDSVYKVTGGNTDGTRMESASNPEVFGWVNNAQVSPAPKNQIARGDLVKLRAQATHWANGDAINIENKTTRTFLVKERQANQLLLYSNAASGWQAWAYDWDVIK